MIIISSRNYCSFNLKSRIQHPAERWISSNPFNNIKVGVYHECCDICFPKKSPQQSQFWILYLWTGYIFWNLILCFVYQLHIVYCVISTTFERVVQNVREWSLIWVAFSWNWIQKWLVKIYKSYTNKLTPSLLKARVIYGHLAQRFRKKRSQTVCTKNYLQKVHSFCTIC